MWTEDQLSMFGKRVDRIEADHQAQRRRSLKRLEREEQVPGSWIPWSKVLLIMAMCIVLKSLAISGLGEGTYRTHVMYLETGSTFERLLGVILTPDRISLELSRHLSL